MSKQIKKNKEKRGKGSVENGKGKMNLKKGKRMKGKMRSV